MLLSLLLPETSLIPEMNRMPKARKLGWTKICHSRESWNWDRNRWIEDRRLTDSMNWKKTFQIRRYPSKQSNVRKQIKIVKNNNITSMCNAYLIQLIVSTHITLKSVSNLIYESPSELTIIQIWITRFHIHRALSFHIHGSFHILLMNIKQHML